MTLRALPEAAVPAKFAVEHVSKRFRGATATHALDDISFHVFEGKVLCLVGPSGCGKTTLLEIMAGLTAPESGRVLCSGVQVAGPGPDRMVMFQEPALFPWLSVHGNVMFGLKLREDLSPAERRERADHFLALVGIAEYGKASIHELSGGMRQRAALARALAPDPDVLLMDEPFGALDAMTREQLYGDLQAILAASRKTMVLVTHNVREAVCLGDDVILMSPRPGRIKQQFAIPLLRPRDINSPELASYAGAITAALKERVFRQAAE